MNENFFSIRPKKEKILIHNKSFCVAPWMHLHIINDGRVFPCCLTPLEDENSFGNVNEEKLINIINSKKAKQMRRHMLNGINLPSSCSSCVSKEKYNLDSMRIGFNDRWLEETMPLIESTRRDGYITDLKLKYWDFRFSNYCNLACTTCGPLFSTQWGPDWEKLNSEKEKYSETRLINLEKATLFWEDIEKNLDYMEKIHFAGGEPLIMPEHWQILKLLDQKEKYDISLKYSTNCTTLGKEDIFAYWAKFLYVHLSLSIDAAHEAYNYIRYRGNWEKTFANLKQIRKSGIVDYWFHPTLSILNIFRITELHEVLHNADLMPLEILLTEKQQLSYNTTLMLKEKKSQFYIENILKHKGYLKYTIETYWIDRFHINTLFTPEYFSITVLPRKLKDQAAEKINKYGKKLEKETGIPYFGWENIINFMYSEDNSHLYDKFKVEIEKLDKIRKIDIYKINPELKDA